MDQGYITMRMGSDLKGILHWGKNMGKASFYSPMVQKQKVTGKTTIYKARREFFITMEITTKEMYTCLKKMEKELTNGIQKKGKQSIRANSKKIAWKALQ